MNSGALAAWVRTLVHERHRRAGLRPVTSPPAALIGVASSAGTHHAGQEGAPAALRAAGFADRLRAAGLTVEDHGDLLNEVFVADAQRHDPTAGLLYLDGDADLATPDTTSSGIRPASSSTLTSTPSPTRSLTDSPGDRPPWRAAPP